MKKSNMDKPKYKGRTTKIKSRLKNLHVNYLTDKLSTTLSTDLDCFSGKGKFLYIGTVLSEHIKNGGDSRPKMGKSETNVLQTITDTSDSRYSKNDPFVVTGVITVTDELLNKFKVKTIIELENLVRSELNFVRNFEFNGNEWWSNETCESLHEKMNEFLFGKKKILTYEPRFRQLEVIEKIKSAFKSGKYKEFLFGAIMRFGKNFSVLCSLVDLLKYKKNGVIVVFTNKPSVFVTLKEDIETHIKFTDYDFINLKDYKDLSQLPDKCVLGVSKQLIENGKNTELLEKIYSINPDYIVIDECHSGIETTKAQSILNKFKNTPKIYISGTPQKQLNKMEFNDENSFIYDETNQLEDYKNGLWKDAVILNTFLISLNNKSVKEFREFMSDEGLFKFSKFFQYTKGVGFTYETNIREFFNDFFGKNKFKENLNFFGKYNHLLMLLPSDTKMIIELGKLISEVLGDDYEVVTATGNTFKRTYLTDALISGKKTIVLTCEKLIEGETVKEWECAINMSDTTSIFKYLQFSYRPTSPNNENKDKKAYFYELNPQTHIDVIYQKYLGMGFNKQQSKKRVKSYYENHNIFSGETINGFTPVNFEKLWKSYSKTKPSVGLISGNIDWSNKSALSLVSKMVKDIEAHGGDSKSVKTIINDNGLDGGKSFSYEDEDGDKEKKNKEMDDIYKEVISKLPIIISRAPMIMIWEKEMMDGEYNMEKLFTILDDKLFEGAFGIEKGKLKKIWEIPDFIDKESMNFDISNLVTSNL
jgi:hypothetical protein